MTQRFLDNWRAETVSALADSGPTAPEDLAPAGRLAELTDLLGDEADFIELTLAEVEGGVEVDWEVVRLFGDGTVERGVTAPQRAWPTGTRIGARLTASTLQAALAGGGISRANMLDKLEAGFAGMGDAIFWSDPDLGAYARHDLGKCFSWVSASTLSSLGYFDITDGYARAEAEGDGVTLFRVMGIVGLQTGTTSSGWCEVTVGPAEPGIYAGRPAFSLVDDPIQEIDVRLVVRIAQAPTSVQDFTVEVALNVPGLGAITFKQARLVNAGKMTITYKNTANADVTINTAYDLANSFDKVLCVNVVPSGDDHAVEIATRNEIDSEAGKAVQASLLASNMAAAPVQFGYTAKITKTAGTDERGIQVKRYAAQLTLY